MPFVTIYKADEPSLAQMAGLGVVNPRTRKVKVKILLLLRCGQPQCEALLSSALVCPQISRPGPGVNEVIHLMQRKFRKVKVKILFFVLPS